MEPSAYIAHVLDPLISPQYVDQDMAYEKAFAKLADDPPGRRDYLRGFKRCSTYAIDWAGDKLLIATKDNALRLHEPGQSSELRSWPGEWMSMQCDPNAPHVAAAVAWGGKFRVFDTRDSASYVHDVELRKTSTSMKEFLFLCWSPDSKFIAVNNRSDQVYLIDLRQTQSASIRLGASMSMQHEVNQMVWSTEGDALWIATGGSPGKLHVYPTPSLQKDASVSVAAHQYTAISLAADPTGRYIASGGGDTLVTLWDPRHLICTDSFGFATQAVSTLGFNYDGSLLAWGTGGSGSTGGEKNLTIVSANTKNLYWQDTTPAPVQQVRWHPNRNTLAYTLNVAQLPDERERRLSGRDTAVVQLLTIPDS